MCHRERHKRHERKRRLCDVISGSWGFRLCLFSGHSGPTLPHLHAPHRIQVSNSMAGLSRPTENTHFKVVFQTSSGTEQKVMVEKSMCLHRYRCHQGAWVAKQPEVLHRWSKGECRQEHTGDLRRGIPLGES